MQTIIIAGVTKPDRYLNTGVAYYFRFTVSDTDAIRQSICGRCCE